MTKFEKVCMLFKQAHNKVALLKDIVVYGDQHNYNCKIVGTVSKFWFGENEVHELIAPLDSESGHNNRPGIKKLSNEYIVVHDTTNVRPGADAEAHAKYVSNGGNATSWHYTVDDKQIYHQIPDDEVAYHAGDGLQVPFNLAWTGIKAEYNEPIITVDKGLYYINGKKTWLKSPTIGYVKENDQYYLTSNGLKQSKILTEAEAKRLSKIVIDESKMNDYGLYIMTRPDGYYYVAPSYYNLPFDKICNRGGNMSGIGIEMCVNEGSNLSITYHRAAKLIAKLLMENNIGPSRVRPHHFFSGKNCPQTLRMNGLWNDFLALVKAEYEIGQLLEGVTVEFIPNSDCIDSTGLIIKMPEDKKVDYDLKLTYTDPETNVVETATYHFSTVVDEEN